jgi:Ca2+-transporting ATPase
MLKNPYFLAISTIMCGGQVLIVMVGGDAFRIAKEGQTPLMWGVAIVLGLLSIPVGVIIRLIPDELISSLVPESFKRKSPKAPEVTVSDEEAPYTAFPEPLAELHDQLAWLKRVKGGRLNNLKFAVRHPVEAFHARRSPAHSREHSRSNSVHRIPQTPTRENSFNSIGGGATPGRQRSKSTRSRSNSALGAATIMTGIVAAGVGVGWSPIDRRNVEPDFDQFRTTADQTPQPMFSSQIVPEPQELSSDDTIVQQEVPILRQPQPRGASPSARGGPSV